MNPTTDEVCRWAAPDGSGSIYLSAVTVKELRAKVMEAFLSLPRRGVETGGLLFGGDQPGNFFIQEFAELPCEHRHGPSFTLSDEDRARLAERVEHARKPGAPPLIGFYRSYTGRKAELDAADLALVQEYFPTGHVVFLLLEPVNAQTCTAGFRFFQDGELLAEPTLALMLFDAEQMSGATPDPVKAPEPAEARELPSPLAAETPVDLPVGRPALLPTPYRARAMAALAPAAPAPPRAPVRWWVPVLLCLIGGIAGASLYELWVLSHQPRWAELYLDAKPSDSGSLLVTWDTAASRSVGATHALLGVNDGAVHRDIPLTQAQLQAGHYTYSPANAEVELRLVLYGNGPAVSGGTLRITPALRAASGPTPVANLVIPPTAAPAAAPAKPEPPASTESKAAPKSNELRAAVHELQPRVPEGIRARLKASTEIPVTVRIDPRGRVTSATTPPSEDGLRRYLAQEAVKAAHQWRFTTARAASEKTLYFRFAP